MKSMTCTGLRTYEKRLSDSDVDTLQANLLEICGTFRVAFPNLSALIDLGSIQKDAGHYVGIASDGPVELGTIGHEERLEVYLNQYPTPSRW
jgi:hypothetical protein